MLRSPGLLELRLVSALFRAFFAPRQRAGHRRSRAPWFFALSLGSGGSWKFVGWWD